MKLRDNLSVVQSMAYMQDAMDKLDDEAEKLQRKMAQLQTSLDANREQRRRLDTGYRALGTK